MHHKLGKIAALALLPLAVLTACGGDDKDAVGIPTEK